MSQLIARQGQGTIAPATGLKSVCKQVLEFVVDDGMQSHLDLKCELEFTQKGMTTERVAAFLERLMKSDGAEEPVVQSGGIYGVSNDFPKLNSNLLMFQLKNSELYKALNAKDQKRTYDMFELFLGNPDLRNRNPIHPSVIDSCLISNLLNFPKHLFNFPYACYATDGNEALSLCLFGYLEKLRREGSSSDPTVVFVGEAVPYSLRYVSERLTLKFKQFSLQELQGLSSEQLSNVAAVVADINDPSLDDISNCCTRLNLGIHVHISPNQWRHIFLTNEKPTHFKIPMGVKSMSIDGNPILQSGYTLYRDHTVRDYHMDVPCAWQSVYISPNEGGSNTCRPLFMDLCTFLLGWDVVRQLATSLQAPSEESYVIHPSHYKPCSAMLDSRSMDATLDWSYSKVLAEADTPRADLELELIRLQLEFMGGKDKELDALTTGGGTRSINLAFECVLARERLNKRTNKPIVLTGNPHLAVERAQRRFGFDLVRVQNEGAICIEQLKKHISNPYVVAVYAQSLSYTDGISDPLGEVYAVIENENAKRERPVYLINDSCLAFNVLLQNDGKNGSPNFRLLDFGHGGKTPIIVINDPHKHLGTDKGISTMVATKGALSYLDGSVIVGKIPTKGDLIRATASTYLVGRDGYFGLYQSFSKTVESVIASIEAAGCTIVHKKNRVQGSTVIAVEDRSGATAKLLKSKGHSVSPLYAINPDRPEACQTGWQLSMTPHCLREVAPGKTAISQFVEDFEDIQRELKYSKVAHLRQLFLSETSFLSFIISGNAPAYIFANLSTGGVRSQLSAMMIRRYCTGTLDYGSASASPRSTLLAQLLQVQKLAKFWNYVVALLSAMVVLKLMKRMRLLK